MSLYELSALEVRDRIAHGDVSAIEATRDTLARIEAQEPKVRAYIHLDRDGALAAAKSVDERRAAGEALGRLAGVPVAIKDNICTRGLKTTCGSKILENFRPPYDAHVIERLHAEDAVIIGKANMDEFAMGSSTENSAFFSTRNPWDLDCIPGGSSGGPAAAVAARLAHLSLGSDTGGSIRQPAAMCGVVGMKPTYGRVSRYGLVAFGSSLDQIGPFGRSVADTALLLDVIAGHDERDGTSADITMPSFLDALDSGPDGFRLGVPREYFGKGIDPEVEAAVRGAIDVLAEQGAEIVDISLPHSEYAVATYYVIAPCEASSNLGRYDGAHYGHRAKGTDDIVALFSRSRAEGFGEEVQRRILLGTYALSAGFYDAYYLKAARVRRLIKQDFDAVFEDVDAVICPTSPTPAFPIGDRTDNPLAMYLADIYTLSVNLAGLPAISVPCGLTNAGLPIGLQIIGKPFDEAGILQIARRYERASDFAAHTPPLDGQRSAVNNQ